MRFKVVLASLSLVLFLSLGVLGCTSGGPQAAEEAGGAEPPPPVGFEVQFSEDPAAGDAPLDVEFTDETGVDGAGVTYLWVFGDGATSTEQSPSHTYQLPGLYSVSLLISTSGGVAAANKTDLIEVLTFGPAPEPEFSATPTLGEAFLAVQFTNESDLVGAGFAAYLWDFGDGSISSEENPEHVYTVPGLKTVSLSVTTAGGTRTETKDDLIEVLRPLLPPVPDFSADPEFGKVPLEVQFTDLSELDGAENPEYFWTYGDMGTSTEVNPIHIYETPGRYDVSLTVTTRGGTETETKFEFINAITVEPPIADFIATPDVGVAPLFVEFTNLSDLQGAESADYFWDFGDEQTSILENPSHIYTVSGVYTVTLTVDTVGGMDSAEGIIGVLSPEVTGDRTFVLTFPDSTRFERISELYLLISSDVETTGLISIPGLSFSESFIVTPGTVTRKRLPDDANIIEGDGVEAKGILVVANDPITVYGFAADVANADGYLGLPIDALGTNYFVVSRPDSQSPERHSEFAVVASEDNTTVTIRPTVTVGERVAGVAYEVVLNRLDVYQLQTDTVGEDLSGTRITSDKPVAAFNAHTCAQVPTDEFFGCDYLVEQIPPVSTWGTEFVTMPFAERLSTEIFRVLAAQDDTIVTVEIDGVFEEDFDLDEGTYVDIVHNAVFTLSATGPILVTQFANSANFDIDEGFFGDPSMLTIMPPERFLSSYTFSTPPTVVNEPIDTDEFDRHFINIVASNADVDGGQIMLDNVSLNAALFDAVPNTGFSTTTIEFFDGSHTITSANPFGLYIYGFGFGDSYAYPGGMAF